MNSICSDPVCSVSPSLEPQSHLNYLVHSFTLASTSHLTPSAHSTRLLPVFPHPSKMLPRLPSPCGLGPKLGHYPWLLTTSHIKPCRSLVPSQPHGATFSAPNPTHGAAVSPLVTLVSRLASEAALFLYSPIARVTLLKTGSQWSPVPTATSTTHSCS